MLKKSILFFILIMTIVTGCTIKKNNNDLYNTVLKKGELTVGVSFDSKPFSFKDSDNEIKGIEPDLAREIAKRIFDDEKKVTFKHVAAKDRIKALKNGDVDMVIATMTITPQRKKIIEFSKPYFTAGQAICVKKNRDIDSYMDLTNKNVIVILGTTGEENLRGLAPNALIQGYIDNADAFDAFKEKENDAITTDDSILLGLVMESDDYKLLPQRLSKEPYGIAFRKTKESKTLRKKVNKILKDIKDDGILQTIEHNWGAN